MKILGIDSGFANFGWAHYQLGATPADDRVNDLGYIGTAKADKKRGVRSTDDNTARCRAICCELLVVLRRLGMPDIICAENISHVRNAGAMTKVGMAWGAVVMLAESLGVPLLGASPQEIKRTLCGSAGASKQDVQDALLGSRYGHDLVLRLRAKHDDLTEIQFRDMREHPFDALGAIVACLETDPIRMARGVLQRDVQAGRVRIEKEAQDAINGEHGQYHALREFRRKFGDG